jgi:hypothetical protein
MFFSWNRRLGEPQGQSEHVDMERGTAFAENLNHCCQAGNQFVTKELSIKIKAGILTENMRHLH